MSVTIAGINFDHHYYDDRGDVLYLSVEGYQGPPALRPQAERRADDHVADWDVGADELAEALPSAA